MKKAILMIVSLFSCMCMFGVSTEDETMFFSPIIYKHVFLLAAKDGELRGTLANPLLAKDRKHALSGQIIFSDLPLSEEMKQKYDHAFSLSFSLVPEIFYKLYIKNDCIMRLEENDPNGKETVYIRNIDFEKSSKFPEDYANLSLKTLIEIYAKEDMLPALKREKKLKSIDFQITGYSESSRNKYTIAVMSFPEFSLKKILTFHDMKIKSTGVQLLHGDGALLLAFKVVQDGYIGEASVCDESNTGFSCHFFPNGYLKDYAPVKSKVWGKLAIWNGHGVQIHLRDYYPGTDNNIPRKYHPSTWGLDDLLILSGYAINKAYYWDEASDSPAYKGVFKTTTNGNFSFDAYFAEKKDIIEPLYDRLQKELQMNGGKEGVVEESPAKFKNTAIGERSFCLVGKNGNVDKLIFQRGIMIIKLENQEGKDARWLAFELDKCWQKKAEEQK